MYKTKKFCDESWSITKTLASWLHASDTWSLRKILKIPYTKYVQPMALSGRLSAALQFFALTEGSWFHFFGHMAQVDSKKDHKWI